MPVRAFLEVIKVETQVVRVLGVQVEELSTGLVFLGTHAFSPFSLFQRSLGRSTLFAFPVRTAVHQCIADDYVNCARCVVKQDNGRISAEQYVLRPF